MSILFAQGCAFSQHKTSVAQLHCSLLRNSHYQKSVRKPAIVRHPPSYFTASPPPNLIVFIYKNQVGTIPQNSQWHRNNSEAAATQVLLRGHAAKVSGMECIFVKRGKKDIKRKRLSLPESDPSLHIMRT